INFGKGSYIISLPKSWVNKNNLQKGALIGIEEIKTGLMLSADVSATKKEERNITIIADEKVMERIKAEIVSAYLNNYDTIEIISKDLKKNIKEIKEIFMYLAGMEILEQTSTRLVAKDLIDLNEISVTSLINRMDIITRSMISDVLSFTQGNVDYESVQQRDTEVNRLNFLAQRFIKKALSDPQVAKSTTKDPWQLVSDHMVALEIEKLADKQKRIAELLKDTKIGKNELDKLKEIYKTIQQYYLNVMKAYINKDKELALDIELSHEDRFNLCNKFLESYYPKKKQSHADFTSVALIIENLKSTISLVKNIARTILGC
ncbi:MAG: phosphate uptake regulator PhoU, partial [Nanoarchaeota archaeon]